MILPDLFEEQVRRFPDKPAVIFANDNRCWTFRELDNYANSVSTYFSRLGLRKGDTVALFMENSPEYIGLYLGLWKIGVVVAFLNHNLRQESLVHCMRVAKSRALVVSAALSGAVCDVCNELEGGGMDVGEMCLCVCGESEGGKFKTLDRELQGVSASPPPVLIDKEADGGEHTHTLTHTHTHFLSQTRLAMCTLQAQLDCPKHVSSNTPSEYTCTTQNISCHITNITGVFALNLTSETIDSSL